MNRKKKQDISCTKEKKDIFKTKNVILKAKLRM